MTQDQFIALWPTATEAERFAAFVEWILDSIGVFASRFVSPSFQLTDGPAVGDPKNGYNIPRSIFDDASSDQALATGAFIIGQYLYDAQAEYYKLKKEEKKQRDKQMDKWLEKMWQERFKVMLKAYEDMAKYFAKKYEIEKGS